MDEQKRDYELGWEDTIENDGGEFTLLPEGEYPFEVTSFERGRHSPKEGGKLPACNKAILTILITAETGESISITHTLFLHSKTEGLLCNFFTAIGQRKRGEKLSMNWNSVIGATGRCKITARDFDKKDGTVGKTNDIKKFCEPPEANPGNAQVPAFREGEL